MEYKSKTFKLKSKHQADPTESWFPTVIPLTLAMHIVSNVLYFPSGWRCLIQYKIVWPLLSHRESYCLQILLRKTTIPTKNLVHAFHLSIDHSIP